MPGEQKPQRRRQFDDGDNGKVGLLRSKNRRIKDKQKEQLLKFLQKLVKTRGLPPSSKRGTDWMTSRDV